MRRLAAAAAAAAIAAAALTGAACGGEEPSFIDKVADERRDQAERVARDAGLPDDVQRFLGQAAAGVRGTFTVVYGGAKKTTLIQRPPARRIDVVAGTTTESVIRNDDGEFACRREGPSPWTCKRQTAPGSGPDPDLGVFSSARIADTVRMLNAAKGDYTFKVETQTVAGAKASCLLTTRTGAAEAEPDQLCISKEGAILRVRSKATTLEAGSYKASADAAALNPPATPG